MRNLLSTTGLFPKTSFLIGIGSVMGIFSPYYGFRYSRTPEDADREAICSDFFMTGIDISNSAKNFEDE